MIVVFYVYCSAAHCSAVFGGFKLRTWLYVLEKSFSVAVSSHWFFTLLACVPFLRSFVLFLPSWGMDKISILQYIVLLPPAVWRQRHQILRLLLKHSGALNVSHYVMTHRSVNFHKLNLHRLKRTKWTIAASFLPTSWHQICSAFLEFRVLSVYGK